MYIKESKCISPQNTYGDVAVLKNITNHSGNKYFAVEPNYAELVSLSQLRRLGKAVRLGIGTGLPLLRANSDIDAMIIGSANGGLEDCINFLKQIIDYEEGTLTPTNFVQSTPNAVTGYLATATRNHCYNNTHVHRGLAFENALLEAFLMINQGEAKKVLVGSVEEISNFNYNIDEKAGFFKKEETTSETLLSSNSEGTVCGEGAAMFVVEASSSDSNSAKILDVDQICHPVSNELADKIEAILLRNNLLIDDIDTLVLGFNGDCRTDGYYAQVANQFPEASVYSFKNLAGEYPSSSSFALWMAAQMLEKGTSFNETAIKKVNKPLRTILIYNNYLGIEHGFILVQKP